MLCIIRLFASILLPTVVADLLQKSLKVLTSSDVLLRKLKLLQHTEALQRKGAVLQDVEAQEEVKVFSFFFLFSFLRVPPASLCLLCLPSVPSAALAWFSGWKSLWRCCRIGEEGQTRLLCSSSNSSKSPKGQSHK